MRPSRRRSQFAPLSRRIAITIIVLSAWTHVVQAASSASQPPAPPEASATPTPFASWMLQKEVLNALDRVLDFILDNHGELNIDGLFGVVFAQAHLSAILRRARGQRTVQVVEALKAKCDLIHFRVEPTVIYSPFRLLLEESLWHRDIDFRDGSLGNGDRKLFAHLEDYLKHLQTSNISESQSDRCLLELVNQTHVAQQRNCRVSNECRGRMVDHSDLDPGYGVTHRLLYLQIAAQTGCNMDRSHYAQKVLAYCSYIFWEAANNQRFGFVEELDDILLEQMTLCGYEGFAEFLQRDFIEHVLDAQHEMGCFSIPSEMFADAAQGDHRPEARNWDRRKKRSANLIRYGCNDHTTGLGASSLAIILRYLIHESHALMADNNDFARI